MPPATYCGTTRTPTAGNSRCSRAGRGESPLHPDLSVKGGLAQSDPNYFAVTANCDLCILVCRKVCRIFLRHRKITARYHSQCTVAGAVRR
jgi:hypothetical protein